MITSLSLCLALVATLAGGGDGKIPETPKEKMMAIYSHLSPHTYNTVNFGGHEFPWTNHHVALLVSFLIVLGAFTWLARGVTRHLYARGPLQNLLETFVVFVRDEMVYANVGEHIGRRFMPLFLTQFFCILVMNLFGILPNFDFGGNLYFPTTATANICVTAGLALVTLTFMLVAGMLEQGAFGFWKNLAPHLDLGPSPGMKAMRVVILGILYPIEILGLFIKPLALTVRLFANMTGGHLAMLTVYGLIYVFASMLGSVLTGTGGTVAGLGIAGIAVAFNVFLTFLETLVAFIQAYVFTYLSILFVGAAVHPEH